MKSVIFVCFLWKEIVLDALESIKLMIGVRVIFFVLVLSLSQIAAIRCISIAYQLGVDLAPFVANPSIVFKIEEFKIYFF